MIYNACFKYKGDIYYAAESDYQLIFQSDKTRVNPNNSLIFNIEGFEQYTFMVINSTHENVYLKKFIKEILNEKYKDQEITYQNIIKDFIPSILDKFYEVGLASKEDKTFNISTRITDGKRIFVINDLAMCREIVPNEFFKHSEFIKACMDEIKSDDVMKKIKIATYFSHCYLFNLTFPITVVNTRTHEREYWYYEDLKKEADEYMKGGNN